MANFSGTRDREKRRCVRLSIHHLLKYKIVKKPEEIRTLSFIRNISSSGALLFTNEYLSINSILELEIAFPAHAKTVRVMARVIRVNFLEKLGGFEVGVEFDGLPEDMSVFIDQKIIDIRKKQDQERGGTLMKVLSVIFLLIGVIGAVLGFLARFINITVPVAPVSWINVVNMILLFSIALSLLAIARK
ncbi:MAG: PilZ domain-containing protein [Candidatus Omnitrophota bacterium]